MCCYAPKYKGRGLMWQIVLFRQRLKELKRRQLAQYAFEQSN